MGHWATDALCKISSESDEIFASYSKTNVSYKMAAPVAILEIFQKKERSTPYLFLRITLALKSERFE